MSIGKIAGLRRLANDEGIFAIIAMDQRNSMKRLVNPQDPKSVPPAVLTSIKMSLAEALSPICTAMLIDPTYGIPQVIVGDVLDAHAGLIITLEADTPKTVGEGQVTEIAPGLSAEKIARMGGDAVKLLVRYRPDLSEAAKQNREVIKAVQEQCARADLPFVLETVAPPLSSESKEEFAQKRAQLAIQTAKEVSGLCDLYKAEFPGDILLEKDRSVLAKNCQELNQASERPWVILSAGADIGPFSQQVEIACQNGASGFLAGRAIWKNYVTLPDVNERLAELSTKAVRNFGIIASIAERYATPWTEHRSVQIPDISRFSTNWYESY